MVAFLLFSCPIRLLRRGALTIMNLSGETVVSLLVQLLHLFTGFLVYLSLRKLCPAFAKKNVSWRRLWKAMPKMNFWRYLVFWEVTGAKWFHK